MSKRVLWSRDEMVLALALYFQLPFGRLNHTTREVQELARLIGRTENSVALRLVNYAACDPYILSTGRHGMSSGASTCMPYWNEFYNDKERLFFEAEQIKARMQNTTIEKNLSITPNDFEGHERTVVVQQRIDQRVFRAMILNNYNYTCAVTGINIPEMLIASHIIPWSDRDDTRLNPSNGICLSPLYDKAFDKGFITISPEDFTIVLSSDLKDYSTKEFYQQHFGKVEHKKIILPEEYKPAKEFLMYHAENVFRV